MIEKGYNRIFLEDLHSWSIVAGTVPSVIVSAVWAPSYFPATLNAVWGTFLCKKVGLL